MSQIRQMITGLSFIGNQGKENLIRRHLPDLAYPCAIEIECCFT
ncbi:hypothetical protein [Bacteroides sp.]|nr:hypothetical protein [Bacteroides sp.]